MSSSTGSIALEGELASLMSDDRLLHSKATSLTALGLVHQFGEQINLELCAKSALVHDIAREWDSEKLLSYAREHILSLEPEEEGDPVLLHAPVGAHLLLKRGYEKALCMAVRYHPLGSVHMGRLGLVLFIADYIEPRRMHLSGKKREELLCLPSPEMICLEILRMQEPYLRRKGKEPARCSEELRLFLLAGKNL